MSRCRQRPTARCTQCCPPPLLSAFSLFSHLPALPLPLADTLAALSLSLSPGSNCERGFTATSLRFLPSHSTSSICSFFVLIPLRSLVFPFLLLISLLAVSSPCTQQNRDRNRERRREAQLCDSILLLHTQCGYYRLSRYGSSESESEREREREREESESRQTERAFALPFAPPSLSFLGL